MVFYARHVIETDALPENISSVSLIWNNENGTNPFLCVLSCILNGEPVLSCTNVWFYHNNSCSRALYAGLGFCHLPQSRVWSSNLLCQLFYHCSHEYSCIVSYLLCLLLDKQNCIYPLFSFFFFWVYIEKDNLLIHVCEIE